MAALQEKRVSSICQLIFNFVDTRQANQLTTQTPKHYM